MSDRHKVKPKAVRLPGGLLAWIEEHAGRSGQPVNAVIVGALEDLRKRTESTRPGSAPATTTSRRPDDCPHPAARVIKGLCGACGTNVS